MPTVLRIRGFRFFFYSNEGHEPAHVHVEKGGAASKWWLRPVAHSWSVKFSPRDLATIRRIIERNLDVLLEAWDGYFGQ